MKKNIKALLKENKYSIGTWMQMSSPDVAEVLSCCGFDWIALDMEHGIFNHETLLSCIRAIEIGHATPFVRVGEHNEKAIKTALECGAKGIIIPMIESAKQLETVVSYIQYPPIGKRGVGFSRANLYGVNFEEYYKNFNSEVTIVAQIESVTAVRNLPEIIKNESLDAIMVGPYDLSASMGQAGIFNNQKFLDIMDEIKSKVQSSHVKMGVHVVNPNQDDLSKAINDNNQFIAYGTDALFLKKQASAFKESLK